MIYSNIISKIFTSTLLYSYHVFLNLGHVVEVLPECLHGQKTHRPITGLMPFGFFPELP